MSKSKWQPDPATRLVLQKVAAAELPPMNELTPVEARQTMLENGKAADMAPPPVADVDNRTIPGPAGPIPVRCYRPRDASELPVLLYFHGGGFVIGDLDTHDSICRSLCLAGDVVVMSVDYRLAPEHRYPAAVEDALAAFTWLSEHAAEIGGDTRRLAVGGDSAGGTLAAVVAQHARDIDGGALRAQLLFYPVVDLAGEHASQIEHADTFPITKPVLDWFWDHYFGDNDAGRRELHASPLLAESLADLAPAFVMTAGLDPLRDEGAAYATRLNEAGVETIYQCVMGTIHGFLRMGGIMSTTHDVLASAGGFVRRRMAESHDA